MTEQLLLCVGGKGDGGLGRWLASCWGRAQPLVSPQHVGPDGSFTPTSCYEPMVSLQHNGVVVLPPGILAVVIAGESIDDALDEVGWMIRGGRDVLIEVELFLEGSCDDPSILYRDG